MGLALKDKVWAGDKIFVNELFIVLTLMWFIPLQRLSRTTSL